MTADNTNDETVTESRDKQLTIRRTFDVPRERVYRAFTDPDELEQWFVPEGMEAEVHALDPVPGGEMSVTWTAGEQQMDNEGTFEEVVENERIVTVEETPQGVNRVTYEFHDADDGTEVVLTHELPDAGMVDGAEEGWAGILDNLEEVLGRSMSETDETENARSITVSRVIEAAPERVYDAFLDPDQLAQWLPPTGFSAEVHHLESEEGGTFRATFTGDTEELSGYDHSFGGTYLELVPGERIVHTDAFETDDPAMAGEMTVTVTFEAVDDGTEVTVHQTGIPEAVSLEDAHAGWTDSLGNLAALVED